MAGGRGSDLAIVDMGARCASRAASQKSIISAFLCVMRGIENTDVARDLLSCLESHGIRRDVVVAEHLHSARVKLAHLFGSGVWMLCRMVILRQKSGPFSMKGVVLKYVNQIGLSPHGSRLTVSQQVRGYASVEMDDVGLTQVSCAVERGWLKHFESCSELRTCLSEEPLICKLVSSRKPEATKSHND